MTDALELTAAPRIETRRATRAGVANGALGLAGLAGMLLAALALCVGATHTNVMLPESIRPAPAALAGPLDGIGFTLRAGELIALLVVMFAAYIVVVQVGNRISARAAIVTIVLLNAIVLLAPPLFSTDIFSYMAYGRMFATYGTNPYLQGPHVIALDPLYPFVGAKWIDTPSVYGPLFTFFSAAIADAGVTFATVFLKATAAVCGLGTVAALWYAARLRGLNPVRGALLVGLNPLVVLYGIGGGHNDLMMVMLTTAGVAAVLARRERLSGVLFVLGAAVKLTGIVVLPFALASGVELGAYNRRRNILRGAGITLLVILIAGFASFGSGMFHMAHTLKDVQNAGDWQSIPSLITTVAHALIGVSVHNVVNSILTVVCVLAVLRLIWRAWFYDLDWIDGAAWATVWILATAGAILAWYVCWLLPLVALCTDRRLWKVSMWMTGAIGLVTVLAYIPQGISFLGI